MTPEELNRLYRRTDQISYGKEREAMAIKHRQADPEPEKADDCPFCSGRGKPTKLGLLMIDREEGTPDANKRWVYCKNCQATGPVADNNLDAVKLWNARR